MCKAISLVEGEDRVEHTIESFGLLIEALV